MDRFAFNEEVDGMQGVIVLCSLRSAEIGSGFIEGRPWRSRRFNSGVAYSGSRSADRRRGMRRETKRIAKNTERLRRPCSEEVEERVIQGEG